MGYPEENMPHKAEDDDTNISFEMIEENDMASEVIKEEHLNDNLESDASIFEKILSSPFSAVLVLITLVLLVAVITTTAIRIFYQPRAYMRSIHGNGRTSDKSALI